VGAAVAQAALSEDDLGAFFDGLMPAQLEAYGVPGAVVTVVHDGEIVFARGYGWADVGARAPVDPETTLFRIGSVTKLFTYTAAMQLVERGELDLDTDVNEYLREPLVPATYPEPVTVRHLMTHTAGFEERADGLFARDPSALRPLDRLLEDELPARVRPPGRLAAYSNHGVGLLGLIVERVAGRSWAEQVETEILAPLGMEWTSARQPLPDALADAASAGYSIVGGEPVAQPYTLVPLAPAGAMAASGVDMARFMIAHLQDGELGGIRILEEETTQRMHARLFEHDPRLPGMAHGFYQGVILGEPTLGHDGGMPNFITRLMLLPERNAGLFVSYNSAGGGLAQEVLARAFVERYAPNEPAPPSDYRPDDREVARIAGSYLSTRSVVTGSEKLGNLIQTITVAASDDGGLRITSLTRPPTTLEPVEPGLWRDVETGEPWVTDVRDGRRVLLAGNVPVMAFQRVPWYRAPGFQGLVLLVAVLLLLSFVAAMPVAALLHRRLGDRPPVAARAGRAVLLVAALLLLTFVVAVAVNVANFGELLFGTPAYLTVLGATVPVAAALVAVAIGFVVISWRRGLWSRAGRVHYALVTLAAAALVAQLAYWNLFLPMP
jgi:CubicO group peptidase (beta-lactamase class C family)